MNQNNIYLYTLVVGPDILTHTYTCTQTIIIITELQLYLLCIQYNAYVYCSFVSSCPFLGETSLYITLVLIFQCVFSNLDINIELYYTSQVCVHQRF